MADVSKELQDAVLAWRKLQADLDQDNAIVAAKVDRNTQGGAGNSVMSSDLKTALEGRQATLKKLEQAAAAIVNCADAVVT